MLSQGGMCFSVYEQLWDEWLIAAKTAVPAYYSIRVEVGTFFGSRVCINFTWIAIYSGE